MRTTFFLLLGSLLFFQCDEEEPALPYHTFELASPQLNLTKKIWVYLPANYETSGATYPVLYAQDGQWLFENDPNYSAEMHVDETLRKLEGEGFEGVIVIGVGSDEDVRADEFALYENPRLDGGGKGLLYLQFLTQTLKPYVDSHYRTKTDRANTAIMGASLGGMATFYALTEFPDVFSKGAMFSAALHFNSKQIVDRAVDHKVREDVKLFGVVGKNEVNEQVDFPWDNQQLFSLLGKYMPAENLRLEVIDDGEHRIWFWDREFPKAVEFLFP